MSRIPSFPGQPWGKIGEGVSSPVCLDSPPREMPFWRETGKAEWIPFTPGVFLDDFRDPLALLGIQEEKGSSPHAWEVRKGSAVPAPRQALPLPGSLFFIFVTVLKPAVRLGN